MQSGAREHVFRYGDVVSLYEPDLHGYISGGGLVEDALWLDVLKKEVDIPPNLKDTRFVLTPRRLYDSKKLVEKRLRMLGQTRQWAEESGQREDSELAHLMAAEKQEDAVNEAEGRRLEGTTVSYGATVQLRHEASGAFVTVVKEVASAQKSALRVTLMPGGFEGSQVIVLPGYRTQPGAARCLGNEVVQFASVKFHGQAISSCAVDWGAADGSHWRRSVGPSVVTSREINCGSVPLRVKMVPVARYSRDPRLMGVVRGGVYVSLHHVDVGALMVREGGEVAWKIPKGGVVAALRAANQSSNGYWKVEATAVEWAGEPVRYSRHAFRLQHVATGVYLSVSRSGELAATPSNTGTDTWWYWEPFRAKGTGAARGGGAEGGLIPMGSTVYLRHHSKKYLDEGGPRGRSGKAKMRTARAGQFAERNAVVVSPVGDDQIRSLLHVTRSLARVAQYAFQVETIPTTRGLKEQRSIDDVMDDVRREAAASFEVVTSLLRKLILSLSLSDDTNPMTREGQPLRHMQKVMRDQGAVDVVMRAILAPESKGLSYRPLQDTESKDAAHTVYSVRYYAILHINQLAYRFIRQMVRANRKNKMICTRHIPAMQSHLGGEMKTAFALLEIFGGNRELLTQSISDDTVLTFVRFIAAPGGKRPRFLRFLSQLCTCDGEPMPGNQDRVVRLFLKDAGNGDGVAAGVSVCEHLLDAELVTMPVARCKTVYAWPAGVSAPSGDEVVLRVRDRQGGGGWVYVNQWTGRGDEVFAKDVSDNSSDELLLRYYVAGLDLLSDVLVGRNRQSFDTIIRFTNLGIKYSDLVSLAMHPRMVFAVRRAALRLLRFLYVDQDPYIRSHPYVNTRPTDSLVGSPCPPDLKTLLDQPPGAESPFAAPDLRALRPPSGFDDLRRDMHSYCSRFDSLDCRRISSSQLILEILETVRFMIDTGIMQVPDMGRWVPTVVALLDGRNDYEERPGARYEATEGNMWTVSVKEAAIKILELMMDKRLDLRLGIFFSEFQSRLGLGTRSSRLVIRENSEDSNGSSDDSQDDSGGDDDCGSGDVRKADVVDITNIKTIQAQSPSSDARDAPKIAATPKGTAKPNRPVRRVAAKAPPAKKASRSVEMQPTDATTPNEKALSIREPEESEEGGGEGAVIDDRDMLDVFAGGEDGHAEMDMVALNTVSPTTAAKNPKSRKKRLPPGDSGAVANANDSAEEAGPKPKPRRPRAPDGQLSQPAVTDTQTEVEAVVHSPDGAKVKAWAGSPMTGAKKLPDNKTEIEPFPTKGSAPPAKDAGLPVHVKTKCTKSARVMPVPDGQGNVKISPEKSRTAAAPGKLWANGKVMKRRGMRKLEKRMFNKIHIHSQTDSSGEGLLVDVLEDCLGYHGFPAFQHAALALLHRHCQQRLAFVRAAMHSQYTVITPTGAELAMIASRAYEDITLLTQRLLANNTRAAATTELGVILSRLEGLCAVPAGEGFEIDSGRVAQTVLAGSHVHEALVRILRLELKVTPAREAVDSTQLDLFQRCYNLLKAMARGHTANQHRLFENLDLFASQMGTKGLNIADTIVEILRNNRELIVKVHAQGLMEDVMGLITTYGRNPRWLRLLEVMIVADGAVVKKHQGFVLKLLLDHDGALDLDGRLVLDKGQSEADAGVPPVVARTHKTSAPAAPTGAGGGGGGGKKSGKGGGVDGLVQRATKMLLGVVREDGRRVLTRHMLLSRREYQRPLGSRLQYHAQCIDVLARCCLGRHASNEAKCRGLVPFQRVMEEIVVRLRVDRAGRVAQDDIRFMRAPFLRFLSEVYVDTNDSQATAAVRRRDNHMYELRPGMGSAAGGCVPLVPLLVFDIASLAARMSTSKSKEPPSLRVLLDKHPAGKAILSEHEDDDAMFRLHVDYVLDAAVPLLTRLYSQHYIQGLWALADAGAGDGDGVVEGRGDVTRALVNALEDLAASKALAIHASPARTSRLQEAIRAVREVIQAPPMKSRALTVSMMSTAGAAAPLMEVGGEDHASTGMCTQANARYQEAVRQFAKYLGMVDLERMMGPGLLALSNLFLSHPHSLSHMVAFWRDHAYTWGADDPVNLATSLRVIRASIYLASRSPPTAAWDEFVAGRPANYDVVELRERQARLADGGALELALETVGHSDRAVGLAALRLCLVLLQDVNTAVQSKAARLGESRRDTRFFEGISAALTEGAMGVREKAKIRKRAAAQGNTKQSTTKAAAGNAESDDNLLVRAEEAVRLVHLLCAGGHAGNQGLMRGQPGHLTSHNIIGDMIGLAVALLPELVADPGGRTTTLLEAILVATEAAITGPSPAAQSWLVGHTDFLELLNRTADRLVAVDQPRQLALARVRIGLLRCLRAVIEDSRPGPLSIRVLEGVDWAKLVLLRDATSQAAVRAGAGCWEWEVLVEETMLYSFAAMEAMDLDADGEGQRREDGSEDPSWCCHPPDENGVLCNRPRRVNRLCLQHGFLDSDPRALALVSEHAATVELDRGARGVQRLLFSTHRVRHVAMAARRAHFREAWSRFLRSSFDDNAAIRVRTLSEEMPAMLYQVCHHMRLEQSPRPLPWVLWAAPVARAAPFYLSVVINLMMVFLVDDVTSWPWQPALYSSLGPTTGWVRLVVVVLGLVHLVSTLIAAGVYALTSLPPLLFTQALQAGRVRPAHHRPMAPAPTLVPVLRTRLSWWRAATLWKPDLHYTMAAPMFSVLGILVSPFFFAYHLLHVARDSITQLVIRAVTQNWHKLARTTVLAGVVLYLFALWTFLQFQDYVDDTCGTILGCVYLQAFRAIQGEPLMSDPTAFALPDTLLTGEVADWREVAASAFGAAWGGVFVVIMLAIVSGIIIDSFGELRDEDQHITDSMEGHCYVCGRSRFELDEEGGGFDEHVQSQHNPLHWLFLLAHLQSRKHAELTGTEIHALTCVVAGTPGVWPGGKAYCLGRAERARAARSAEEELRRSGFLGSDSEDEGDGLMTVERGELEGIIRQQVEMALASAGAGGVGSPAKKPRPKQRAG